jgi:ubiquinone/menaquinone biosynthesis C-methylase UbiE
MNKNNNYTGRISPEHEEWTSSIWTDLLKERYSIASMFCADKGVLDTCCGTGWGTLNYIVPKARFTTGFDLSTPDAKPQDEAINNFTFLKMDARKIDLDKDSFDLVLSLDAIEHLNKEDGEKYLREMKKVCTEHGFILGTTPLVIHKCLVPIFLKWNKYHRYMYTRKDLKKTLEKFFPVVKIYEIYSPICPYFLFICSKTDAGLPEEIENKMRAFFSEKKLEHIKGKFLAYVRWLKALLSTRHCGKPGSL